MNEDRASSIIKITMLTMENMVKMGELHPGYLGGFSLSDEGRAEAQALVDSDYYVSPDELAACTTFILGKAGLLPLSSTEGEAG